MFKTVVLSGLATDAGKTSTVDNLFAPRVGNLIRVEIEHANKGSAKEGVNRIRSSQLAALRSQLIDMEEDQNLIVDLGASEYREFMAGIAKFKSTAAEFDRFVLIIKAQMKQDTAMKSIAELLDLGIEAEKIVVIFNRAPFDRYKTIPEVHAEMRLQFEQVFEAAGQVGFHVVETPILDVEEVYKFCFQSPKWTIDGLASAPSFREEIRAFKKSNPGQPVPANMFAMDLLQEQCRSFVKVNLDLVWKNFMALDHAEVTA